MKIVLLGTTGYHPNNLRHTSCIMLPELGLVLDAGTAMFRVRDYLCTRTLDVFLTHAHLDHIVGLTFLFDVLYQKEMERVHVHAEAAKIEAISRHLFDPEIFPVKPPFEWRKLENPFMLSNGGLLTHFPLIHPGGSVGFRLDYLGKSMAYITDTTANVDAPYVERIRGVDLLIHECYFPDGWEEQAELTGHSWTSAVAAVARAAQVGKLVLVHVNPLSHEIDPVGVLVAQKIFAQTELAIDEMEIVL